MAYGVDALRKAVAAAAGRPLGLVTDTERIFQSQVDALQHGAALTALPVDASAYAPIQTADGSLLFMPDWDAPDAPRAVGGEALVLG
jgi:hypothetical protein